MKSNLPKLIKESGQSMQDIARQTGISFSAIRSIAIGATRFPRVDTYITLEKYLKGKK